MKRSLAASGIVIRRRYEQFVRLVEAAQFMQSQRSQRAAVRASEELAPVGLTDGHRVACVQVPIKAPLTLCICQCKFCFLLRDASHQLPNMLFGNKDSVPVVVMVCGRRGRQTSCIRRVCGPLMVGLIKIALRRSNTFIVMAVLIMIFEVASALRTSTDIC